MVGGSTFKIAKCDLKARAAPSKGGREGGPRLLTDLIRFLGTGPSGIGSSLERAEVIAKDNKYQLIDSFTLC
jgi:hypothetical protein